MKGTEEAAREGFGQIRITLFYTKKGLLAVSVRDGAMAPYHKLAREPCGFTRSGREDGGGVGTGYPGTKRFAI